MAKRSSSIHLEKRTWDIIDRFKEEEGLSSRNIALELIIDRWARGNYTPSSFTVVPKGELLAPPEELTKVHIATYSEETDAIEETIVKPKIDINSKMLDSIFDQMDNLD